MKPGSMTDNLTDVEYDFIIKSDFKEFKNAFPLQTLVSAFIKTFSAVRSHLELAMSQDYKEIKDAHKKHIWLNQKLADMLRYNSNALYIQKVKEDQKKKESEEFEKERQVGMSPVLAMPYGKTPMEEQNIVDTSNGERRVNVVPGSEV